MVEPGPDRSLIDPAMLPLATAIHFAKRWQAFDPMLDIKLLHAAFPSEDGGVHEVDIVRAKRALAIVSELPANRRVSVAPGQPDVQSRRTGAVQGGRHLRAHLPESGLGPQTAGGDDSRVRANAVESLWGQDSDLVRAVLQRPRGTAITGRGQRPHRSASERRGVSRPACSRWRLAPIR